ncbi:hypothetical protein PVAND_007550 [Polypedilum vanderplanki]|uniref:Uncharacterized protein n=1 Tax=Polypedilum vanderplanki TaxID=319348 RepID=A0A9J6C708_POLVA|nr:hypothetical protein PVAND_007550 [Polypedilum vanderplanki]
MFRLDKCCLVFELEIAICFFGFTGIVISATLFLAFVAVLFKTYMEWDPIEQMLDKDRIEREKHSFDPSLMQQHHLIIFLLFYILFFLYAIFASALLIRSAYTKNPRHVKPGIFLHGMLSFITLIIVFIHFNPASIVCAVFSFYVLIIIFSTYLKFKENNAIENVRFHCNPNFIPIDLQEKA